MENNYTSNSHKAREGTLINPPAKKTEKVISGTARTKKKSEVKKFADVFISEDISNIKTYVLMDVLVPAIKKAISDIVKNGIEMVLYGEAGRQKLNSTASKISYRSYYDDQRSPVKREYAAQASRHGYDYDDIILETYSEAEDVLTRMDEMIDRYKMVSVADLYDMVDISGPYTNNYYGWTDLRSAEIKRADGGYLLKFPKTVSLK